MQIGKLARAHNLDVTIAEIEADLGYPLVEASMEELRGVIAGLNAVVRARVFSAA
jgi:hypothetical protein